MEKKEIVSALDRVLEEKGKRKFTQSVEAIFNFKGVNFSKPENRMNLDIILPKGRGKEVEVIAFAEGAMATDAKKEGIKTVIDTQGIADLKKDKKKLKEMANNAEFIAEPKLMVEVGKNLGQVLGSRQKLPKPIVGTIKNSISQARSRVRISTRGKYLPTVMCMIGTENMSSEELYENFNSVYEKIKNKVGEHAISKIYVKTTMGKAVKIGAQQEQKQEE